MKSDFFDNLRKEVKDVEDIVASLEAEEAAEAAEVEAVEEEEVLVPVEVSEPSVVTRTACEHCGAVAVEWHDGNPYSVGGDTSSEALKKHGLI